MIWRWNIPLRTHFITEMGNNKARSSKSKVFWYYFSPAPTFRIFTMFSHEWLHSLNISTYVIVETHSRFSWPSTSACSSAFLEETFHSARYTKMNNSFNIQRANTHTKCNCGMGTWLSQYARYYSALYLICPGRKKLAKSLFSGILAANRINLLIANNIDDFGSDPELSTTETESNHSRSNNEDHGKDCDADHEKVKWEGSYQKIIE